MSDAASLYSDNYADLYPQLYIAPWPQKHALNTSNLARILDVADNPQTRWLDMACGQAWHFRQFPGRARMTGLDLSQAQLARAKRHTPAADFVCANALAPPFAARCFDLVTNFWAGYCYFGAEPEITVFLGQICQLLRPGGTFYMEVLLARDLASFNRSRYAASNGFAVQAITADYRQWVYDDAGGRHFMTSPELDFFTSRLAPSFDSISAQHDGGFMVHLVASGRKRDPV